MRAEEEEKKQKEKQKIYGTVGHYTVSYFSTSVCIVLSQYTRFYHRSITIFTTVM